METSYKGNNKMLTGIVFGVLTYWLFSQITIKCDAGSSSRYGNFIRGSKYSN